MKSSLAEMLICPKCCAPVVFNGDRLNCSNIKCASVSGVDNNIVYMLPPRLERDIELTMNKWDMFYREEQQGGDYDSLYREYIETHYDNLFKQLQACKPLEDSVFLELGCGPMLLGQALAGVCSLVIGVEISKSALEIAKNMFEKKGIKNYLLICGDINHLPLRDESIDVVYGGGVIEHFRDTRKVIREMYRVLRKGGVAFNTVPYLNIAALTYSQMRGNIPNVPLLRQVAEFVHIRLLRAKHMTFGYELSFTSRQLIKMHEEAGFSRVVVEKFDTPLSFDPVPFGFLRKIFTFLADNSRFFWPLVKVTAEK